MKIGGKARQSRVSTKKKAMDPIINKFPGRMGAERPGREADERLIWELLGGRRMRDLSEAERMGAVLAMPVEGRLAVLRCLLDDLGIKRIIYPGGGGDERF
jgi:hypothetical protein